MIVDDSVIARSVLSRMIESDHAFEIAAVAASAEEAIEALASVTVDIVLLDLEMPGAGGLKMIPDILRAANGARVMIVSSVADDGAEQTVAALALGATDAMPKPGKGSFNGRFAEVLLAKLKSIGFADSERRPIAEPIMLRGYGPLRAMAADPISLLAIGASTGGIHAISALFKALPPRIHVPILVTQHLPAPFMPVFARQLGIAAGREALVAESGMPLLPDRIVIAPGDAHLTIERRHDGHVVALVRERASSGCMPSVDPMFASAAVEFGASAVGVILTGMGRDGVEGAGRLVACGGSVLAQDEASCAVWGMPRTVVEAGLACAVMPPDKIGRRIASRTGDGECK
ncbi:chemotaxis-specific protein-glutamate methyltransferase CheB [Sphingomonas sabuli]|uniref:protein-glutamate methylesterase n=2 Tax=Sphingomonas sabuli TaxID=2764186 RepID=A0A7G9L371_9SPHN|nr:chemotaxis-specific protein-glutamate methyltransferase CheB [Sphingomonas sabuli]